MGNRFGVSIFVFLVTLVSWGHFDSLTAQDDQREISPPAGIQSGLISQRPSLIQADTCEKVENLRPVRQGLVFSVSAGQVCCFTSFDPVPQASVVYHRWYHRDQLSTQIRLRLYPPKWSTYSVIQLRETDKGPWRIEITDANGYIFKVLRFSITD